VAIERVFAKGHPLDIGGGVERPLGARPERLQLLDGHAGLGEVLGQRLVATGFRADSLHSALLVHVDQPLLLRPIRVGDVAFSKTEGQHQFHNGGPFIGDDVDVDVDGGEGVGGGAGGDGGADGDVDVGKGEVSGGGGRISACLSSGLKL
jgi:hypothetical protein